MSIRYGSRQILARPRSPTRYCASRSPGQIAANVAKLPELLGKNWRSNSKAAEGVNRSGFALRPPAVPSVH
jgi:hypothetical protein